MLISLANHCGMRFLWVSSRKIEKPILGRCLVITFKKTATTLSIFTFSFFFPSNSLLKGTRAMERHRIRAEARGVNELGWVIEEG